MTLKAVADLATSLTLIVAAITFVYTVLERNARERRQEIQDWQQVVVYGLIEQGHTTFDAIKTRYVVEAQQFPNGKIPKKDIQDGALKRLLLSMIEARLISVAEDGRYVVNRVSLSENRIREALGNEIIMRNMVNVVLSRVFQSLESDSGKYTLDHLYRHVNASEAGVSFEIFDVVVRDQITRAAIVASPDGKLWARGGVPQRPAANQPSGALQKS